MLLSARGGGKSCVLKVAVLQNCISHVDFLIMQTEVDALHALPLYISSSPSHNAFLTRHELTSTREVCNDPNWEAGCLPVKEICSHSEQGCGVLSRIPAKCNQSRRERGSLLWFYSPHKLANELSAPLPLIQRGRGQQNHSDSCELPDTETPATLWRVGFRWNGECNPRKHGFRGRARREFFECFRAKPPLSVGGVTTCRAQGRTNARPLFHARVEETRERGGGCAYMLVSKNKIPEQPVSKPGFTFYKYVISISGPP